MKSRAGPNGATRRYHGIPFKRPTILPVTPNTITNYAHTTTITLPLLPYHYYYHYYPTTTFQLLLSSWRPPTIRSQHSKTSYDVIDEFYSPSRHILGTA